jgi:hypothetical protein
VVERRYALISDESLEHEIKINRSVREKHLTELAMITRRLNGFIIERMIREIGLKK